MPFLTPKHLCESFREPLRVRSRPVGLLFPGQQHGSPGCNLHCWHSFCPWLFLSHVSFMQTNPESSGNWFKIPESHKKGESIILVPRVSFFRGRREETVYNYASICGGCCWGHQAGKEQQPGAGQVCSQSLLWLLICSQTWQAAGASMSIPRPESCL